MKMYKKEIDEIYELCKRVANEVPTANASFNYSIYGIEKLNAMLKDFPAEYGYLLSSAALSACPKNTVIADMVIENILYRKSYRKISRERYIPMNPKDFYGYRRKTVAVLYERMRLLGVWEEE